MAVNTIQGDIVSTPIEIDDLLIKLNSESNGIIQRQPSLDISDLTFTGDARSRLHDLVFNELGAFAKIDYSLDVDNLSIARGYLDRFLWSEDRSYVKASFTPYDSINDFAKNMENTASLVLADDYELTNMRFIIEGTPEEIRQQALIIAVSIPPFIFNVIQVTKNISDFFAEQTNPDPLETGEKILKGIALGLSIVAIGFETVNLYKNIFRLVLPPIKKTKVVSLYELLIKPIEYHGYKFNIQKEIEDDLKRNFHWASRYSDTQDIKAIDSVINLLKGAQNVKSPSLFVPNSRDVLSTAIAVVRFIQRKYAADVMVQDNTVFIYNRGADFWEQNIAFDLEDDLPLKEFRLNVDEHIVNKTTEYATDDADNWTFEDYKGFHFLVTSQLKDFRKSTAEGSEINNYGIALVNRKDSLNIAERALEGFTKIVARLAKLVGKNIDTDLTSRIGLPRISRELTGVAKLVYLDSKGRIPKNHRDILSAKSDYQRFQFTDSWTLNPKNKEYIYEDVRIKMNSEKFGKLLNIGFYIGLKNGDKAKVRALEWKQGRDFADAVLSVEKDYLTKLEEDYYESEK